MLVLYIYPTHTEICRKTVVLHAIITDEYGGYIGERYN